MELSRRAALRAVGGLSATAGLAGCIERRVTSRETRVENSTTWALNPDVGAALERETFESEYVDRMADRYGDSGVWGLEAERPEAFETAYVQRLVVSRETAGRPGGSDADLHPDAVDLEAPLLIADAAAAVYETGDDRNRYWLWLAVDGNDDRLVRDVDVSVLSTRVAFREGVLTDAAQISRSDGAGDVSLGSSPSGRFPLKEATTNVDTASDRGEGGSYFVDWSGNVGGAQSVNGVCEEERTGPHDFFWGIAAGYTLTERV